ncbi:hypothetical protein IFR05_011480 [Cadophora sp. M221]|nr:hypothetical protein IFR05_011480 [Cadophora sp. M221]
MSTPNWLAIAVVLFFTFLGPTTAFQCGNDTLLLLSNVDDIERNLTGCTSWLGDIKIAYDWNGPFSLPNITNITGYFTTETYRGKSYDLKSSSLTSITAVDLESVDGLIFEDAPLLSTINITRLKHVNSFRILLDSDLVPNTDVTLIISSLLNASSIRMAGNFPFVDFPKLETVEGSMEMTNNRSFIGYDGFYPVITSTSMAINMPSLYHARSIQIAGNITDILMPSLATMSRSDGYYIWLEYDRKQLEISLTGEPLAVSFPSLRNVTNIDLSGALSSPLSRAESIELSGNVTDYNIDSLTSLDRLSIITPGRVDCEPATAVWTRIHPPSNKTSEYTSNQPSEYTGRYLCADFRKLVPEKSKKPFPAIPVGLTVGIGIPVWLFFIFALWHSRKQKKKAEEIAKIPPPDYDAEMAARSAGGGEVLPGYEPRRSQGSEGQPGSVIELIDMTRPSPHPPGYEAATGGGSTVVPDAAGAGDVDAGRVAGGDGPGSGVGS